MNFFTERTFKFGSSKSFIYLNEDLLAAKLQDVYNY